MKEMKSERGKNSGVLKEKVTRSFSRNVFAWRLVIRYITAMLLLLVISFVIFNWKLVTQVLATIGKELSKLFTWNLWGMPILLVGIATLGVILWAISYNGAVTATKKAKHKKEERLNKAQQ